MLRRPIETAGIIGRWTDHPFSRAVHSVDSYRISLHQNNCAKWSRLCAYTGGPILPPAGLRSATHEQAPGCCGPNSPISVRP
jgi:hypothetical protein